jgi:tRNA threonylcarbamoyladenosine biosynthesis protein TsaB
MIILGIDTTSPYCGVSLLKDGALMGNIKLNSGNTHSVVLMPSINNLLKSSGLSISDVDLFAVTSGPGSFTGVRIGVSTVKGLAFASDKPVMCISTLRCLAENLNGFSGIICPIMDARRNQVYTGVYAFDEDELTNVVEQQPIEIDKLVAILEDLYKETGKMIVFLGDGVPVFRRYIDEKLSAKHTYAPAPSNRQRASSVATLGLKYYNEGQAVKHEEYTPEYLRKSQAEMVKDGKRI